MAYLLDSNVFIEAKAKYYGMDFCPAFWEWLIAAARAGTIWSVVQVADELQDDELNEWLPKLGEKFFRRPDEAVLAAMAKVSEWVNSQKYTAAAKSQFFGAADYHLVGHALAAGHVVVTHEQIEHTPARVKIPNVCIALDVNYVPTHVMLRRERARFILAAAAAPTGRREHGE